MADDAGKDASGLGQGESEKCPTSEPQRGAGPLRHALATAFGSAVPGTTTNQPQP